MNDGSGGFQNAPANTLITFTKDSGPGTLSALSCLTIGATGSCTVDLTSSTTGVTTVSAHVTVTVGTVPLTRNTDGTGDNSLPAVKTWVNARISIAPDATNEVGKPHTFVVTVQKDTGTGTFVAAANEHVDFTLTNSNGAGAVLDAVASTCDNAGANTDLSGQCTIVFSSPTAGKVTGHASATLAVNGSAPFTIQTDGTGQNSGNAVKTYVDANIQIAPNGVNRIGQTHTFTAHVNVDSGTGGSQNAPAGTVITFTKDSGPGNLSAPSCTTVGATGSCTVDLTSNTTGVTTVSAHTTVSVGNVALTRNTNGSGANSVPAVKTWVNARISIAPDATNEVNHPHTFTVTVEQDLGTGVFVPASLQHVDVTLTPSNGASVTLDAVASTCDDAGPNTNAAGQCTVVFTSPTAGKVTAHASATLSVGGSAVFTVQTDGAAGNSGNAVKTFVDANIQLTPNGVNRVGDPHTFTAHVNVDDGSGAGFVGAPAGTLVTFAKDSGPGSLSAPSCTTVGQTGSCSVTLTSTTTGLSIVSAHTTVTVGGVALTRNTDGQHGDSEVASKRWVDAKITIAPDATNRIGQSHTFMATLWKDTGDGNGFVPAAGEHVTVTLTDSSGATHTAPTGTCTTAGANTDANGQCAITFTSNTTGKVTGHGASTLSVGGSAPFTVQTDQLLLNSGDAVKTFVNARISIAPSATNEVGKPHTFTVTLQKDPGTGTFVAASGEHVTVTLTDSNGAVHTAPTGTCTTAGANTDANGQCTITFTSNTTGKVTAHASATLAVNGSAPFTVETDGTGLNSGNAVKTFVDANIQITPQTATNPVGVTHVFTAHVNVDLGDGAGLVNAPANTPISFTVDSGPGGFTSVNPCTTVGATGSCTITLVSNTPGTTVVSAHVTTTVGGIQLTRSTDGTGKNSGPATKLWADSTVRTDIHDASHNVVTSVLTGTSVHDKVFVAKAAGVPAGVPAPTGNVTFHRYPTINCTGAPVDQVVPLGVDGTAETSAFTATSDLSYRADYGGDANYPAKSGACEPLTVSTPPPRRRLPRLPRRRLRLRPRRRLRRHRRRRRRRLLRRRLPRRRRLRLRR